MPNNYAAWPTVSDVLARLMAAGISARVDMGEARFAAALDSVTSEVGRRTLRQFVADTADTVRFYDGSASPEQEVDEMVSLTSVSIVGLDLLPVYTLTDAKLTVEQTKPQTRITVARGSVPAFTSEAVFLPYPWRFPAGRQNIQVTGRFGYAATVPADLWDAVAGEAARRLAGEALFVQGGRLQVRKAGDEEERYALTGADALDWGARFDRAIKDYKRPAGRRLRGLRNRMVD